MPEVTYQKIDLSECYKLKALIHQLGYDVDANDIKANVSEIRERQGEVFVAKIDDELIGCINAIIDVRLAAGTTGEIVTLVVLEQYRGMGVGKALVATAEAWLAERVSSIRVRTNSIRDKAHRFYQRAGYQELKTQKIFIKDL
jgi:GNAT superfamily N-acetyltransferase